MKRLGAIVLVLVILTAAWVASAQDAVPTLTNRERVEATATAFSQLPSPTMVPTLAPPTADPNLLNVQATATALVQMATARALNPPSSDEELTLSVGESRMGELSPATPSVTYRFSASEGEALTFSLSSSAFDAYLQLLQNGEVLVEDDDGGDSTNSRITGFVMPSSGEYELVVTSYSARNGSITNLPSGSYTVSIETVRLLEYNEPTIVSLANGEVLLDFAAEAGDAVIVSVEAIDDVDPYVRMNFDGYEIGYDDDGGEGLNSLLGPININESGIYNLSLNIFNTSGSSEVRVTLRRASIDPLTIGEPSLIAFEQGMTTRFLTFTPQQVGDAYSLVVIGEDLEIVLRDGYNSTVLDFTVDDPNGVENIFYVNYVEPFTLSISGNAGTAATVLLNTAQLPVLSANEPYELTFDASTTTERIVTFKVADGERVRLTLEQITSVYGYNDMNMELTFDGEYIGYMGNSIGDVGIVEYTFDDSGEARIRVTNYNGDTYRITLERLGNE